MNYVYCMVLCRYFFPETEAMYIHSGILKHTLNTPMKYKTPLSGKHCYPQETTSYNGYNGDWYHTNSYGGKEPLWRRKNRTGIICWFISSIYSKYIICFHRYLWLSFILFVDLSNTQSLRDRWINGYWVLGLLIQLTWGFMDLISNKSMNI